MDKEASYLSQVLRITTNDIQRVPERISATRSNAEATAIVAGAREGGHVASVVQARTTTTDPQQLRVETLASDGLAECDKMELEKMCRICYVGETKSHKLIAPCLCSGSTKYTHEKCLLEWFTVKKVRQCELCLYPIQINQTGMKPLWKWRRPKVLCDLVVSLTVLYSLVMLMFVALVTWIASSGNCYSGVCIVLYCLCLLAIVYFCYCCIYMGCMKDTLHAFLTTNRQLSVIGRQSSRLSDMVGESKV